jgi:hypothetical protein
MQNLHPSNVNPYIFPSFGLVVWFAFSRAACALVWIDFNQTSRQAPQIARLSNLARIYFAIFSLYLHLHILHISYIQCTAFPKDKEHSHGNGVQLNRVHKTTESTTPPNCQLGIKAFDLLSKICANILWETLW